MQWILNYLNMHVCFIFCCIIGALILMKNLENHPIVAGIMLDAYYRMEGTLAPLKFVE